MAPCTYKNFVVASISDKNQRKECKTHSEGFKFAYKIFKTYFNEYIILDESDEEHARGMSMSIKSEGDGDDEEGETAAAAFGVSNFFGFQNKKR